MAINLEDHAVFIERLQMDMVPLSIAQKAVEEAANTEKKLDEAMDMITKAMSGINETLKEND
jgi:hypothetical protein